MMWTAERITTLSGYRMKMLSGSVSTTTAGRNEFRLSCMQTWNASWRRRIVIWGHLNIIGYLV